MQTNTRSAIDALSVLSQSAHSPFHCCKYCEDTLKKADFLADRKGNAGCVVKIDIIFSAGCKGKRLIFGKCKKAGFLERVLAVFTAVERRMGTLGQYGECIYGGSCICLHDKSPSLKIKYY